jgi:hypothetical protein
MSSFLIRITLLVLLFTATGCPYESEVPIDEPSVAVPTALPGAWKDVSDSGIVVTVTQTDAYSFHINYTEDSGATRNYSAHLSRLRNVLLLNLHPLQPGTGLNGPYAFYKFELSADGKHLTLTPVTDNIREKFTSSRRLKAFFRKYVHTSFFYPIDEEFRYEKKE